MHLAYFRINLGNSLTQGIIQSVDRSIALCRSVESLLANSQLDHGFSSYGGIFILFNYELKILKLKEILILPKGLAQEKLQRGIGTFKLQSLAFQFFNLFYHPAGFMVVIVYINIQLPGLVKQVR